MLRHHARILLIIESADYVADETAGYASRGLCTPVVESNAKKRDEGANRANWAREHSRRSAFSLAAVSGSGQHRRLTGDN